MNQPCTERRAALIAALIAVPAAILIAMLVHYFVAIPQAMPKISGRPQMPHKGERPAMDAPMKKMPREDLTPIYQKRVELATVILKYAQNEFKAGKLAANELIPLEVNCRLAENAYFRYVNKVRARGISLSDTAVKYDGACRLVKDLKARYQAGKTTLIAVSKTTDAMLELEAQLKGNRNYNDEAWQNCYEAYRKSPNADTCKAMLEAERNFPYFLFGGKRK